MENEKELVLVVRDTWYNENNGYNIGGLTVAFGLYDPSTKKHLHLTDYGFEKHSGLHNVDVRCQWSTEQEKGSSIVPFIPYAIRVEAKVELNTFERVGKVMKKVQKHFEDTPIIEGNFGHYVYEVCKALKVKLMVVNPDNSSNEVQAQEIKNVVDCLNLMVTRLQRKHTQAQSTPVAELVEDKPQN